MWAVAAASFPAQASLRDLKKRGAVFARIRYESEMTARNANDLAAKPIA
jgi:hypothetical protein